MIRSGITFFLICFTLTNCRKDETTTPVQKVTIGGQDYVTVKIGNQTWTAVNYAGPGGVSYDPSESRPEYGKYYSKAELQTIALPAGWRIPTQDDYKALGAHHGFPIPVPSGSNYTEAIKSITSKTNWKNTPGTNASGFNAHPAGYVFGNNKPMDGDIAEFWATDGITVSIQEAGADLRSLRISFYDSSNSPDFRFNVRFVRDN